jgi:hypothetical protein
MELRCGYKDILLLESQHFLLQFSTLTHQLVIAMRYFIAKGTELIASSNVPNITDDNIDAVIDHHLALLANEDGSEQNYLQMHVDFLTHIKEEVPARRGYLKEITERHESRIQERWMKKTIEERRQLLLSVWPYMSPWHQFESFTESLTDIDTTADKKPVPRKTDKATSDGHWPYINLEDVVDPKLLMVFINSRARSHPEKFSLCELDFTFRVKMNSKMAVNYQDCRAQVVPELAGENEIKAFLACNVQLVNDLKGEYVIEGVLGTNRYGCVFTFPDEETADIWDSWRCGCHLREGLRILQVQHGIYSFLSKCCEQILHDIPSTELICYAYPVQLEPPSPIENSENCSSFADAAKRPPYLSRDKLHFLRLRYLILAAASEARDHLWSLREDPSYFADTFESMFDHDTGLIPHQEGVKSDLSSSDGDSAWEALRKMVAWSYKAVIDWETIDGHFTKYDELWHNSTCSTDDQVFSTKDRLPFLPRSGDRRLLDHANTHARSTYTAAISSSERL